MVRLAVLILAILGLTLSVWRLESFRSGLERSEIDLGGTPATVWRLPGAPPAPVAVIAHGFAGSRQLMEGFAVTLARAGYVAVAYDLAGHGRNPKPMSGDVTRIDGTTLRLMDELARVSDAARALPGSDGRLALIGHSMASDVVVRQGIRDPHVGAVVAVSMFSGAVTATEPARLLVVAGSWETYLAGQALLAVQKADPAAGYGQTVPIDGGGARRAVLAPSVEHVGVLYSATTLRATRDWLDAAFGRSSTGDVAARGGWVALLLVSVVALGWPLAGLAARWQAAPPTPLPRARFWAAALIPAIVVPLVLTPLRPHFLPVLVADYLTLHLAAYGVLSLTLAGRGRLGRGWPVLWIGLVVATFGIFGFGTALDRYVASFWPVGPRLPIVAAVMAGAVPFMLADAALTGVGPLWRVVVARAAALGSLMGAVALDFERLMFLVIILPVILLFFLLFGTLGGWVSRATGRPGAAGIGLGLFLGWALGVTFPLFAG